MPKLKDERIALHLSKGQVYDVIKAEVHHLYVELDAGVDPKEIIHRAEQIERLAELLPR